MQGFVAKYFHHRSVTGNISRISAVVVVMMIIIIIISKDGGLISIVF